MAFGSIVGVRGEVLLHDRQTGATVTASVSTGGDDSNGESRGPAISAAGRGIVFISSATTLVRGDPDPTDEVFLRQHRR